MNLDFLLYPLTQCVLLAAGLIASLCLVAITGNETYSLKRRSRRYQHWTESMIQQLETRLAALQHEQTRLRTEIALCEIEPGTNWRVIQMARQGEGAEQIAAALCLPRPVVELMLSSYFSISQLESGPRRAIRPTTNKGIDGAALQTHKAG